MRVLGRWFLLGKTPLGQHSKGDAPQPRARVVAVVAILLAACAVCAGVIAAQMGGLPKQEAASGSKGSGSWGSAQVRAITATGSAAAGDTAGDAEESATDKDDADDDARKTSAPRASDAAEKQASEKDEEPEELALADIDPLSFDTVPASDGLATFSLVDGTEEPGLSSSAQKKIESAANAVAQAGGELSVVFVDMNTGAGIAYAPDTEVYGASSFKAPYALYVCEQLVEKGKASLDDVCTVGATYGLDEPHDPSEAYATRDLISNAITVSDNDSFKVLRNAYDAQGYESWVQSLGVTDALIDPVSYYPVYCARSSARLWCEMLAYLGTGTKTAQWLEGLLEQTTVSFIRAALEGEDVRVLNKAGWLGGNPGYNSVTDAGIIECDGHTYLMCLMSSMSDGIETEMLLEQLASALFEARDALA